MSFRVSDPLGRSHKDQLEALLFVVAAATIITLAALLASFFVFWSMSPGDTLAANPGSVIVQQGDTASSTSPTVVMAPEGLAFKGTFRWEDRDGPVNHWSEGPCYLWIYTTEWGTMGAFDFQEDVGYLRWNGRDLPLETHTGTNYVFLSSDLTMVDHWKMVVDVTNTGVSGTITNFTPEIGSFVGGAFSGTTIPYEQYKAEAPN